MTLDSVFVVGSVNVDTLIHVDAFPSPGETVRGEQSAPALGGKGANQAIAARLAGASTFMIGLVGNSDGQNALIALQRAGVDTTLVSMSTTSRTGSAVVMIDRFGQNEIIVSGGANLDLTAANVEAAFATTENRPANATVLANLEVPDEAVVAAARSAREHGWAFVLNPAPFRQLPAAVAGLVDVLTPNETELSQLLEGQPWASKKGDRPSASVKRLLDWGVGAVVVTLGHRGAALITPGALRTHPAEVVEIVDTTGAGDAFNGALAAALAVGEPLDSAVSLGMCAGSRAVRQVGALGALGHLTI
jgi:ribokinase